MTPEEYISIYERYMAGECTEEEKQILKNYCSEINDSDLSWNTHDMGDKEELGKKLLEQLQRHLRNEEPVQKGKSLFPFLKYAAAILVSAVSYYIIYTNYQSGKSSTPATVEVIAPAPALDIAPGGNKAILTLSNGAKVTLDDAAKGMIARQGKTSLHKQVDGSLEYIADAIAEDEPIEYNTVTTPRGGQYKITLPDGSNVWLNASSSIRFPTRFFGKTREVEVTGEIYFEVHKNPSLPFHITANAQTIEVLGTTFNLMAYDDELEIKTTLVEGAVKVSNTQGTILLRPGEQSICNKAKQTLKVTPADVDEALAWKTGQFIFNDEDLQSIMRKVGRWYDVEVDIKEEVKHKRFTGGMSRFENASRVLNMLQLTGAIHFKIEERRIKVMP